MTAFIGVYKALYDYEPQTPEELAIKEDDILYLLETSDVDDWWTVKKRVLGSDAEEPVGLVPSNYVEPAPVISQVRAIYDYEEVQNPQEELTFHENDIFDVFDDQDKDWMLVQSQATKQFGFVPGNYVELAGASSNGAGVPEAGVAGPGSAPLEAPIATAQASAAIASPAAAPAIAPVNASILLPPPQHPGRTPVETPIQATSTEEPEAPPMPTRNPRPVEEDDVPPPKPTRPQSAMADSSRERARSRTSYHDHYAEDEGNTDSGYARDDYNYDDGAKEYRTWNVAEIDGRKKRKCKLSIGGNKIYFQPQKGGPEEWTIDKLTSYDHEKKHMFLEFVDPYKSLELHTGNNDTCEDIMTVIAEYKGASRDAGLREVEMASKPKKQGTVLYDFIAESQDELTVKQGQTVLIINDKKSRDWWMCELTSTGQRGVVPAQFVDPIKPKSESSGGLLNSLKKFTKGNNKSSEAKSSSGNWKDDEEQDISAERRSKNKSRSGSTSRKKRSASTSNKLELPDPKKSRIWADRSGTFKVEAQFIGCSDGKIHLHKSNGVKIAVAADKLSDDDILYVERATGFSLDKYKTKKQESKDARDSERERRRKLKEHDEKERDRKLREKELDELRKARLLLDEERAKLQERELPPIKPPRPQSTGPSTLSATVTGASNPASQQKKKDDYDWFEFFLNCGVDVSNCQRYTLNFEREQVTEDMMADINSSMLRTLGLKEGDIVRVMKHLDAKFGRDSQLQAQATSATGGMFSEPDGSLKVAAPATSTYAAPTIAPQLLPQNTAAVANTVAADDDAWTVKPAAKAEASISPSKSEFTGSMQDLLDLQPLEPKKKPVEAIPQPNIEDLEPVKSSHTGKTAISAVPTGGPILAPLDPFKTGGHNLLPMATGFVMMPIATGGLMPMQRTGGLILPQTTFGIQPTGGLLQPQRTSGPSIPMMATGGLMPQTSFQTQQISTAIPLQRTGGALAMAATGGALNVPPLGSVLPLQKTATGLMPANITGGVLPVQSTSGLMPLQTTGGLIPLQRTGGIGMPTNVTGGNFALQRTGGMNIMPQTSFTNQLTGGANMMPQTSFGANVSVANSILPQTSFVNQTTGGMNMNMMPQTSFASNNVTGGANFIPQTSFANNVTGGANIMPQTSFVNSSLAPTTFPQTSFNNTQVTGGFTQPALTGNLSQNQSFPNMTGPPQANPQFGFQATGGFPQNQFTGQPMQNYTGQPAQQFQNNYNSGVGNITQGLQNASISQPPALQTQPTGFGFGNGPQVQQQQQPRQANLYNATADNPFGF